MKTVWSVGCFRKMTKTTHGFISFQFEGSELRKLKSTTWTPEGKVKALAFLCHGYGECLGLYYDEIASAGANQGILVFGHDHIGHGLSQGERVQIRSIDDYVLPVLEHCGKYKALYPDVQLFVIGRSMGGLISVRGFLDDVEKGGSMIDNIVLISPLVEPDPKIATPFRIMLCGWLANTLPSVGLGSIEQNRTTSDETWNAVMEADQNRWHGRFKAQYSHIILTELEKLHTELGSLNIPLLVLHGDKDSICTLSGSQRLYDKAQSKDKTIKILAGGNHNLLNEVDPIRSTTINTVWDWVKARI